MPIYTLQLVAKNEVARGIVVFTFTKPKDFTFLPGQYGGFTLINPPEKDNFGITRRFSLLNSPKDPHLTIATRVQANVQHSAFKRTLLNLSPGEEIKFAGPTGNFTLHEDINTPAVFIAGGIGIAPFYSMLNWAAAGAASPPITLFYGNQSRRDAAFLNEFQTLNLPHFTFIPIMNSAEDNWPGEQGFITDKLILKHVPDIHTPYYYICGSPVMVTTLQETLAEMGINEDNIRTEDFPGY